MPWTEIENAKYDMDGSAFPDVPVPMSLRDYFAGQAISQLSETNPNLPGDRAKTWPEPQELADRRAKWAYLQADAMLAARNGK